MQYKNLEPLLAYLLPTKVLCKAAEIAATMSLKGQSFFRVSCNIWVLLKKSHLYWDYCIMTNSLTCIIAHLINQHTGHSNWPLLSCLLLYWITGIGIVIHYKHNLIHSYIQSLNPILKILKFKYLQIRHKPRNQLATKVQSFHKNPLTPHPPWQLITPEISHEIEGTVQIPHP